MLSSDAKDLEKLDGIRKDVADKCQNTGHRNSLNCFSELISAIKLYGAPQFSRQARYAFIAKSFCRSLVSAGYFSSENMSGFMQSVRTIASDFSYDLNKLLSGQLSIEDFNKKYGHLRSGTYDITTLPYSKMDFKAPFKVNCSQNTDSVIGLDEGIVGKALNAIGFTWRPDQFILFLKSAFEQREFFKFEFTKSLSLAIEILATVGDELGFTREELSFLTVGDVLSFSNYDVVATLKEFWHAVISGRKQAYSVNSKLILPDVIFNKDDLTVVEITARRPNFITDKITCGNVIELTCNSQAPELTDKIVLLERADPGFDWIFAKNIMALVTKYGGAASHMAIRCNEFGLPAAIGCGEKIYNEVRNMRWIELDCKNGRISEIYDNESDYNSASIS
ncbi:MAG: hypothetical protein LBJ03_02525 [Holosporales bacterium]|jgi:phosphohistidine swiveling domain-containing protein|nr:hypothetical protein [Holosporales bacterium]